MISDNSIVPMENGRKIQPIANPSRKNVGLTGAIIFIVSETMFFLGAFYVWFYLRETSLAWPPLGIKHPNITLPIINSAIMIISTIAMIVAERGVARNNQKALIGGISIAAACGLLFLSLMILEFSLLGFNLTTNAFGSSFVVILVFHVVRVFAGVVLMSIVLARALLGQLHRERRTVVQACAVYWYFISAVWFIVFYVLYVRI